MEFGLVIFSAFLFLYAMASKRLGLSLVTAPLLFASFGWITGLRGLDVIEIPTGSSIVQLLLEGTLVLVLFTDAFGTNSTRWRSEVSIPIRLLGVGLPLTLLAGWALALVLFDDLAFWEAGLMAVVLTPTDAALGQAVVSNPRVPHRIRQAISVESGLNDGIMLPIFFVMLEAASASAESLSLTHVFTEITKGVVVASAVGLALGWSAARLIRRASDRGWVAPAWRQVSLLAVAFASWSLGDALGGSGFISAWVAGLVVGVVLRNKYPRIREFAEDSAHIFTVLSFFVFGSAVLGQAVIDLSWQVLLYAVLSLTVVRMVPVAVGMIGSGLRLPSVAYLGWFGPRGLASIILVLIILEDSSLPGTAAIGTTMGVTVALSIFAHGVTAWWGSNRYADWYERARQRDNAMSESAAVPEVPISRRLGPAATP